MLRATAPRVTDHPAAPSAEAEQHFARLLSFEADCWDVHHDLTAGETPFVLLDVRRPCGWPGSDVP